MFGWGWTAGSRSGRTDERGSDESVRHVEGHRDWDGDGRGVGAVGRVPLWGGAGGRGGEGEWRGVWGAGAGEGGDLGGGGPRVDAAVVEGVAAICAEEGGWSRGVVGGSAAASDSAAGVFFVAGFLKGDPHEARDSEDRGDRDREIDRA